MEQSQSFFQKVGTRKERERAFLLLTQTKSKFECQLPGKKIVTMVSNHIKDSNMVVISQGHLPIGKEVIVTFQIGQEKYFMKTTFEPHDFSGHYLMNLEPPLFKLQRRNSFRVQIPLDYMARIHLLSVDDVKSTQRFVLFDLSGGGFSFEIPAHLDFKLKQNQNLECELEIGGKFKKRFTAIVRHVINVGSQGSGLKKIGVEFTNISPSEQQEVITTVMEIHRDMFSKFKIGSR